MRHFRKVVGDKYSDFRVRLPDCRPPLMYALGMLEDGTTEESRYPNFMLPEAREEYGL